MVDVEGRTPRVHDGRTALALLLVAAGACGQELEPGAYSPAPVGYQIGLLSDSRNSGDVSLDPSSAVSGTRADVDVYAAGYVRSLDAMGRAATVAAGLPYVRADVNGLYFGQPASAHRSAFGDAAVRFAVNLYGAPALAPRDFAAYQRDTIVGVSLVIVAPTGAYDDRLLVNVGNHRWATRPELGVSKVLGKVTLESDVGAWFYTDNRDYLGGKTRSQTPVTSVQAHAIYTFYPRAWLSIDANYYAGGRVTVNDHVTAGAQHNSRAGLTGALPIDAHQSLKLSYSRGARVTLGGDFTTFALSYQYGWL